MARTVLLVDPDTCGACRICEMVCSLARGGECNPALSRIRILRGEMKETPLVCRQCEVLFCAAACPQGAIRRDPTAGTTLVDEALCNGCQRCRDACPFQAIAFDAHRRKVLICDHCGGEHRCAAWCPRGALRAAPLTAGSRRRKAAGGQRIFALLQQIRPRLKPAEEAAGGGGG